MGIIGVETSVGGSGFFGGSEMNRIGEITCSNEWEIHQLRMLNWICRKRKCSKPAIVTIPSLSIKEITLEQSRMHVILSAE